MGRRHCRLHQSRRRLIATQHVVWGNLADAYVGRAKATPAGKDADLAKAAEAYQKAIAIKADDAAYLNNYALVLAQQKKFDEAQAQLTKAAQVDPPNAGKYYFNLGAVYVNTGNMDPGDRRVQEGHRAGSELRRSLFPVRSLADRESHD